MPDPLLPQAEPATVVRWNPPALTLRWGPYNRPDPDDKVKQINATKLAYDGGLITLRKAVESIKDQFGIEAVDAFMDELEEERAKKQDEALKNAESMAKISGPPKPGAPNAPPKPSKPEP